MSVQHYQQLIAWQKGIDFVVEIYRITEEFPKAEVFGLRNQLRRAAVSVPSNIAEGQGRATTKDFVHFLHIARGSLQEFETQLVIASRLKIIDTPTETQMLGHAAELGRILNGLIRSLSN
jgi:four helix bundle protein